MQSIINYLQIPLQVVIVMCLLWQTVALCHGLALDME